MPYRIMGNRLEEHEVVIDKDFEEFMKSAAFFQR